jgi:hypothetical protein
MTDSRDRISGPMPADSADDDDSQTFFDGVPPEGAAARGGDHPDAGGGDRIDGLPTNAGYTGGLASGTGSAAGMRGLIADEHAEEAHSGEPDANLAQQDQ